MTIEPSSDASRSVRVVVFTGGPTLRYSIRRFIQRLEDHPEIDLLAVYCQSPGATLAAVWADLWRRRKLLAVPLLILQGIASLRRWLRHPAEVRALRQALRRLSPRIRLVPDIHAPAVLDDVRQMAPDLGLIYGSPILKPSLFQLPVQGTLGIHHGTLPAYRGKKTTFWALYHGESTAGVTIQRINAGLDTGEVVTAGAVPAAGRPLRAVWRDLEAMGLDLYLQAILAVRDGTAVFTRPEGVPGPLYRDPSVRDIVRFWWRRRRGRQPNDRCTDTDASPQVFYPREAP